MSKATNKATGVVVSGDETTLRRLGPGWEVEGDKPKTARKPATPKKSSKSDD